MSTVRLSNVFLLTKSCSISGNRHHTQSNHSHSPSTARSCSLRNRSTPIAECYMRHRLRSICATWVVGRIRRPAIDSCLPAYTGCPRSDSFSVGGEAGASPSYSDANHIIPPMVTRRRHWLPVRRTLNSITRVRIIYLTTDGPANRQQATHAAALGWNVSTTCVVAAILRNRRE